MTAIAFVIAPTPAGARSAAHANNVNGIAVLMAAIPTIFHRCAAVNCLRSLIKNGNNTSAPSTKRTSTNAYAPKSLAAMRMKRNEAPQIAPSTVNSTGVIHTDSLEARSVELASVDMVALAPQ